MRTGAVLGVVLVIAAGACGHRQHLRAHKRIIAILPTAWTRGTLNVADDGDHFTCAVHERDGYHAATPAGRGPGFAEMGPPLFAAGSTHVFYWGRHDDDGRSRYAIGADTATSATPFAEPPVIVTSRGGARWAAIGPVDADPGAPADAPAPVAVVVDGREMGRWPSVTRPDFSPDGAHVAWIAREAGGRALVLVDGSVVRAFDATPPTEGTPSFEKLATTRYLSDGRLVTLAPDHDGWSMRRGEELLASYGHDIIPNTMLLLADASTPASVVAGSLVTAAKAPVAVWWERMAGAAEQWRVVRDGAPVDGVVCDHYWSTQPPVVTDDGVHVAYVCPTPVDIGHPLGRRYVVLDGRRFGVYVETWTLGLASDGSQVAYGAADTLPVQGWRVYANGVPRTPPFPLVWRPRFSPDTTRVFWAAGPERGRRGIGVDMRTIARCDDILYGPEFPDERTAVWVVRRGRKISRIEATFRAS